MGIVLQAGMFIAPAVLLVLIGLLGARVYIKRLKPAVSGGRKLRLPVALVDFKFTVRRLVARQRTTITVLAWAGYCTALLLPNLLLLQINRDVASVEKLLIAVVLLVAWHLSFRKLPHALLSMFPIFLILPIDLFFTYTYQEPPTSPVAGILAHTSLSEALDYLQGRKLDLLLGIMLSLSVWWCSLKFVVPLWTTRHLTVARWIAQTMTAAWIVVLAWSVLMANLASSVNDQAKDVTYKGGNLAFGLTKLSGIFPFGRIFAVTDYLVAEQRAAILNHAMRGFSFGSSQQDFDTARQVYVLVIGEAGRRDRWQITAHQRATNPRLSVQPNLVALTDVVSPWTWTDASIPVIVSRKSATERSRLFPEKSVVSLFKEAGFHTVWMSNQARQSPTSPIGLPAAEADEVRYLNVAANDIFGRAPYDEVLISALRDVLTRPYARQFVIIHLLGSHDSYEKRYPKNFGRWQPSANALLGEPEAHLKLSNSYDNSVLYSDYVVSSFIELLRQQNLLGGLYFVSDHGESLLDGECSQTGHGNTSYYNYPVPAFAWLTDRYVERYPNALENLLSHSKSKLTTANTFDSLAELAHINYRGEDATRSVFSSQFRETPRLVNVGEQVVDWDQARFVGACRKPTAAEFTQSH